MSKALVKYWADRLYETEDGLTEQNPFLVMPRREVVLAEPVDQLRTEALALANMLKSEIQHDVVSTGADYVDPLESIPEWQAAQRFIERYAESSCVEPDDPETCSIHDEPRPCVACRADAADRAYDEAREDRQAQ